MTDREFGKICAALKEMPPRTWSEGAADLYGMVLGRLDYAPVRDAIARLICKATFRPVPAEILAEMAHATGHDPDAMYGRLAELRDMHGEMAWHEEGTPAGIRVLGPPNDLTPAEAEVIHRLGGWLAWCRSVDPTAVERAQVRKIAETVVSSGIARAAIGPARQERPAIGAGLLKQITEEER